MEICKIFLITSKIQFRKVKYGHLHNLVILNDIEKIKQILNNHEKRISELEKGKILVSNQKNMDVNSIQELTDLLNDSFFDQPRKYGQIVKQLKINATFSNEINYKTGLQILVKEKKLKRKIIHHQWVYFKNE